MPASVANEQAIFLADSLPTGYEVGVLAGKVRPGDTVAVVGAGAVGLSAILTTGLWGASRVIAIGVHGVPVSLPMQDMWIQNVTLTMGLVDTVSIPPC